MFCYYYTLTVHWNQSAPDLMTNTLAGYFDELDSQQQCEPVSRFLFLLSPFINTLLEFFKMTLISLDN